jgi:hypothetical protein
MQMFNTRGETVEFLTNMERANVLTENEISMLWGLLQDKTESSDRMVWGAMQFKIWNLHENLKEFHTNNEISFPTEIQIKKQLDAGMFQEYIALEEAIKLSRKIMNHRKEILTFQAEGKIDQNQHDVLERLIDGQYWNALNAVKREWSL